MLVKETAKMNGISLEFIDNPEVVFKPKTVEFNTENLSIEIAFDEIGVLMVYGENTLSISTLGGYRALIKQPAANSMYTQIISRLPEWMVETTWNC